MESNILKTTPSSSVEASPDLTDLFALLLGTRAPSDASAIVVEHLIRTSGGRPGVALYVHPHDGRLHGCAGHLDADEIRITDVRIDPVVEGGLVADALAGRNPVVEGFEPPAAWPQAFDAVDRVILVPLRVSGPEVDPIDCPRFDCPERCGRSGVCGAGKPPEDAWTRDRLTCGLLPVVGLVGVGVTQSAPEIIRKLESSILALAPAIAPLFQSFRLQEALNDAEYFREDVFDSMTEGIVATNLRGEVLLMNRAAEDLTGVERHDARGRPIEDVLDDEDAGPSPVRETLQRARSFLRVERRIRRPDGRLVPVSITTAPITARGWGMRGVLVSVLDLSSMKRMQGEIRRLDRLATLGRFTSAVAHEVRNPLAGILAGVQHLRSEVADTEAHGQHFEFIESEIQRLNRIVEDLTRVTRSRSPALVEFSLGDVLERVATATRPLAEERGVTLVVAECTLRATLDPDQIVQVLLNLVRNGIEACQGGGEVLVRATSIRRRGRAWTCIEVKDDGPGIASEDLDQMFEPFFTTKQTGTGLGLFVSHGIAERHGGHLSVKSAEGVGSTFTLDLPAESGQGLDAA